jgi:hypothetical protein
MQAKVVFKKKFTKLQNLFYSQCVNLLRSPDALLSWSYDAHARTPESCKKEEKKSKCVMFGHQFRPMKTTQKKLCILFPWLHHRRITTLMHVQTRTQSAASKDKSLAKSAPLFSNNGTTSAALATTANLASSSMSRSNKARLLTVSLFTFIHK